MTSRLYPLSLIPFVMYLCQMRYRVEDQARDSNFANAAYPGLEGAFLMGIFSMRYNSSFFVASAWKHVRICVEQASIDYP